MLRKFGVFATTLVGCTILAGFYGILHDQVTCTISPEYYSKFKFIQFGIEELPFTFREKAGIVGFLATWWTGIFIGLFLGIFGFIFRDYKAMSKAITKSIGIVFLTAILTGFIGFLFGRYHLLKTGVDWWLPENLVDKNNFITVGSIHNFSYLGGLLGLIFGIGYLILTKNKSTKQGTTITSTSK